MQISAVRLERERVETDRQKLSNDAERNPYRHKQPDPLNPRHECPLGRLRLAGKITEAEYQAGVSWRNVYFDYLETIGAPHPFPQAVVPDGDRITGSAPEFSDEDCEKAKAAYERGLKILNMLGRRVMCAVNSVCVFEDTEELGDFSATTKAARIGLSHLAKGK